MAQANLKSITTTEYEIDLAAALKLTTQAESSARESVGWAQIIATRLGGEHIDLAGRDVLCRCAAELRDAAAEVDRSAQALCRLTGGE